MARRDPRRARSGFTLVELIVATMLLTIVLAAVYTAFGVTTRSWRVGEASMESYQGLRTSLAMLTRELQSVVPGSESFFEGEDDELVFFALAQPLDVEEGRGARILQVRYRLKENPDGPGKVLVREEAPLEEPLPVQEEDRPRDRQLLKLGHEEDFVLAHDVRDFQLTYHWAPPEDDLAGGRSLAPAQRSLIVRDRNERGWGLPQGIRIRITVGDANDSEGETTFATFVAFQGPTTRLTAETSTRFGVGTL